MPTYLLLTKDNVHSEIIENVTHEYPIRLIHADRKKWESR